MGTGGGQGRNRVRKRKVTCLAGQLDRDAAESKGLEQMTTGEFKSCTRRLGVRGRQAVCRTEAHVPERVGNRLGCVRRVKMRGGEEG